VLAAGRDEQNNPRAILDLHTVGLIAASAPGFMSGKAVHYCAPSFFTSPVNIELLVASTFNAEYACIGTACGIAPPVAPPPTPCVTTSIPCTGLETEEVKRGVTEIAVTFFGTVLKRSGDDGIHFTRYLAPKWLLKHVPNGRRGGGLRDRRRHLPARTGRDLRRLDTSPVSRQALGGLAPAASPILVPLAAGACNYARPRIEAGEPRCTLIAGLHEDRRRDGRRTDVQDDRMRPGRERVQERHPAVADG
jgi:hypothetical protein